MRYVLYRNILNGDALSLKTVDEAGNDTDEPIIFSEWSIVMDDRVKRRDFRLDEMLEGNVGEGQMCPLFGADYRPTVGWVALQQNPARADFSKRYESIIDQYNKEQDSATIEATFEALMKLSQDFEDEQKRYVHEGFTTEEQLAVFDTSYKDSLSKEDIKKVKGLCVELVETVRNRLAQMSHWTEKPETLAEVDTLIRDELYKLPEQSYPDDSITRYRAQIFDYFYSRAA